MISSRLASVLALSLLAACGGGGDAPKSADEPPAAPAPAPAPPAAAAAATGDTITIRMVTTQAGAAGQFEPTEVSAKPGDVLHFVADGGAAHNVSFPPAENAGMAGLPGPSTYLVTADQAVDVPVTFAPGTYTFVCDPHTATGMKGKLTVTG
ncbi:MAG TPA: plastocyanin/azurin family copper-binding protein [Longimicrobium sp.]|nr:plastocyanin/azurin family copper-binding protein [Longimicrobium sp.]